MVITFFLRSKHLLISWLQSPSAVILEPKKIKFVTVSIFSPSLCYEVRSDGTRCHYLFFVLFVFSFFISFCFFFFIFFLFVLILVFQMLSFKPAFSLSSFTFIKRLFSFSLLSALRVVSLTVKRLWCKKILIMGNFFFKEDSEYALHRIT